MKYSCILTFTLVELIAASTILVCYPKTGIIPSSGGHTLCVNWLLSTWYSLAFMMTITIFPSYGKLILICPSLGQKWFCSHENFLLSEIK